MKIIVPKDIKMLSSKLHQAGFDCFLVGGCVRDAVLRRTPKDWDVATNATPDEVLGVFSSEFKTLEIGKSFGVVSIITDEFPEGVEFATFRADSTEGDGRRPDSVVFTTIEEDVKRRDFTINALFYDIEKEEIVDLVGGLEDLKNKVIRAVGNPFHRFKEDKLRMLRALRFSSTLDFEIEENTFDAILSMFKMDTVSKERVMDELRKIAKCGSEAIDRFLEIYIDNSRFPFKFEIFDSGDTLPDSYKGICDDFVSMSSVVFSNRSTNVNLLIVRKFTYDEAKIICFLISLKKYKPNNMYTLKREYEFLKLYKGLKDSHVKSFFKIYGFKDIHAEKFINFKLTIKGSDYKGKVPDKEIGISISKNEELLYQEFLKKETL